MRHVYGWVRGLDLGDAVHMTRDLHADHAIDGVCVAQEGPTAYQACAYLEELQGAPELGVLVVLRTRMHRNNDSRQPRSQRSGPDHTHTHTHTHTAPPPLPCQGMLFLERTVMETIEKLCEQAGKVKRV